MDTNSLPQNIIAAFDGLRKQAATAWKQNDFAAVERHLAEAWDLIPSPKTDHKFESQTTLNTRIKCLILIGQAKQAKLLLNALRDLYEPPPDDVHVATTCGIVCFECGDLDEAFFEWFDKLYKQFKTRPFQGIDDKYLKFYRQRVEQPSR